ncbi:MAG: NADH:flavin oxidoreductase [Anaerolineae bacterium]|nr:NADH:flavin oxidoreductase [Anaerolineae bacterium]
MSEYRKIAALKTAEDFAAYCRSVGADLAFDPVVIRDGSSPLAQPYALRSRSIGNRIAVLPMEGWDGTEDGLPTDLTRRRWQRFGLSGAKLIWGGEAVAVRHDGRANPNQLVLAEHTVGALTDLRQSLVDEHAAHYGRVDDLMIGLQLTHSGRFARPNDKKRLEPRTAYRHPILDRKFSVPEGALLSDDDIDRLVKDFGRAAVLAERAGFDFVDLKHCHGYFGHELLSAVDRPGKYGGSFENRTRFMRELVAAVRAVTRLDIGVRLSAFDFAPYKPGPDRVGVMDWPLSEPYRYAFGGDGTGCGIDLTEPKQFLDMLRALQLEMVCITAGSPYYNPHIQRPAITPPSDGYLPPEDPLVGVARQINVVAALKRHAPGLLFVGTGYSYLQEWLPNVAQRAVVDGLVDFVGLGRMVLSYPEILADALRGREPQRKKYCRTFSDCTTGPRNGLVSGCYPLDDFYKIHPHKALLDEAKKR